MGTNRTEILAGPQVVVICTVRVMATKKADGPQFEGRALKSGAQVAFNFPGYMLNQGEVLSVKSAPAR